MRAVLFDLDGTLIDSNAAHVAVWEQVFREAGHPQDRDAIAAQIGKGGDLLVPTLLPDAEEATCKRIGDRHGEVFKADWLEKMHPFPGAHDLLARVHAAGMKVVLASSASSDELDHYVGLLDARELVAAGTSIDDVDTSKPAPDIFAAALEKVGVAAGDALVIGDTPYDVEAARGAGVRAIAVRSGGFDDAALSGAVALYDDVSELLARWDESVLAG